MGPRQALASHSAEVELVFDLCYTGPVTAFQGSLLDPPAEAALLPLAGSVRRMVLAHGAWVDVRPGWLPGADAVTATCWSWGGSCQRTWDHAVPKSARVTGARISVQFRPRGVR